MKETALPLNSFHIFAIIWMTVSFIYTPFLKDISLFDPTGWNFPFKTLFKQSILILLIPKAVIWIRNSTNFLLILRKPLENCSSFLLDKSKSSSAVSTIYFLPLTLTTSNIKTHITDIEVGIMLTTVQLMSELDMTIK